MPPFVFFDSAMLALAAAAVWTIIGDDFNFMYPGGLAAGYSRIKTRTVFPTSDDVKNDSLII